MDGSVTVINVIPSWQIMFNVLTGTFSVVLAASLGLMLFANIKGKKEEE